MASRVDLATVSPGALQAMYGMEKHLQNSTLEPSLRELVKMRASQINGCAYCIDMHSKNARAAGESEQRLYALSAWKETPFYTDRERAALLWTETLTRIADAQEVSDEVYEEVKRQFTDAEVVDLTLAVVQINSWNRIAKSFRTEVGGYQPGQRSAR